VSPFDFDQFDPESYATKYPMSDWFEFVPYREKWGSAAWIEIDRGLIASQFISGTDLVERWKSANAYEHNFMPFIEAAHLGPLRRAAFKRTFLIGKGDSRVLPLDV